MSVAIQRHLTHFGLTDIAARAVYRAIITIAQDLYRHFPFAVAQGDIRHGYRHLEHRIAKKLHPHPQPMIFHLFGQLAFQVGF